MFQMDVNESQTNAKLLPMYYDYLTTNHVKVKIIKESTEGLNKKHKIETIDHQKLVFLEFPR